MKYRTNTSEVTAQKIVEFMFDAKTTSFMVKLEDGTLKPEPHIHGMKPEVGDYYVEEPGQVTKIKGSSRTYTEAPQTAIIKRHFFERFYTKIEPENDQKVLD